MYKILVLILIFLYLVKTKATQYDQTPAARLSSYEKFKDLYILQQSNFSHIFTKKEPWIIVIHEHETILTAWKTMAASVRGMVWVGLVNASAELELMNQLQTNYNLSLAPNEKGFYPAIVFPYGSKRAKQAQVKTTESAIEAKKTMLASIPDPYIHVTKNELEDFFLDSFTASPTKFPALLITESRTEAVFRSIALRFERYFHFRKMVNPTNVDLESLGLLNIYMEFPAFLVLTTRNPADPSVHAIMYNKEEMGEVNYPTLLRFLFSVNDQYRYLLPGNNMADDKDIVDMQDVREIEKERFDLDGNQQIVIEAAKEESSFVKEINIHVEGEL